MDIQRLGFSSENIARFIAERTDIHIQIARPANHSSSIMLVVILLLITVLLYFKRDNLEFLYNKTAWGTLALTIMLCMTSGQMWNHIRNPAFSHVNHENGRVSYIHGGNGYQLIALLHHYDN